MSYEVFARKYRPQTFDDVVGQEHITRTLRNAIEQNRLAHAYIFVGPRGTGKTSTARILAKSLNCQSFPKPTITPCGHCDACKEIAGGNSLDVLEFDAASNTQVDKVREIIIDNVKYAPSHGRYKVYIVDEVHMLSPSSFNALLKTLEEPPAHVKFIFATTDVQKVPTTILSRCQRFDLKRISTALIARHLEGIAQNEKIVLAPEAADAIARGADGGMRDAESMLDQLVAFCGDKIDEADVLSVFGLTSQQTVSSLCQHLIAQEIPEALAVVHAQAEDGRDLSRLMSDLIAHLRNVLVAKADREGLAQEETPETVEALIAQGEGLSMEKLLELIEQFAAAEQKMRYSPNRKMHFEIAVIRAIQTLGQASLSDVLDSLASMRGGAGTPAASPLPKAKPAAEPRAIKPPPPRTPAPAPAPAPKPAAKIAEEPAKPIASAPPPPPPILPPLAPIAPPVALPHSAPALIPATPLSVRAPSPTPAAPERPAPAIETPPEADPGDLNELWGKLIAEVKKKRPLIQTWVDAGKLLSLTGRTAVVGFPAEHSLAADYCQQAAHRKFLEETLGELAGRPVSLKCEVRADLIAEPPKTPEPERDPVESFRDDPLIRKALDIFRGEIQIAGGGSGPEFAES